MDFTNMQNIMVQKTYSFDKKLHLDFAQTLYQE